jgi:hypothetical protein
MKGSIQVYLPDVANLHSEKDAAQPAESSTASVGQAIARERFLAHIKRYVAASSDASAAFHGLGGGLLRFQELAFDKPSAVP